MEAKFMKPDSNPVAVSQPENPDHIYLVTKLLRSRRKAEALRWLLGSRRSQRRVLGEFKGAKPSLNVVKELYAAGAIKIIAVDIQSTSTGTQRTDKLVMELPADAKMRSAIFRWCKRQGARAGYSPEFDGGEKHLYLAWA